MERYQIGWTPSPSPASAIAKQQVLATVADAPETALTPVGASTPDIAEGVDAEQFDFLTDAPVTAVVVTFGVDGSSVRSDPFTFTATDQNPVIPIEPASGLSATWVSHAD
jgi:hypothetical protein